MTGTRDAAWGWQRELRRLAPDRFFASLFASERVRTVLGLLHLYDLRLRSIRDQKGEAQLRLIKLAWWRDAAANVAERPIAKEPLLAALAVNVPRDASRWAALAEAHMDGVENEMAAAGTGAALFLAAGHELDSASAATFESQLERAGNRWASGEIYAPERIFPPALRPITALAAAAAFSGRTLTRRQIAILVHMLTGRY